MDSIFRVELSRDTPDGLRCVDTTLPLTDYGLLDAMDRLQAKSYSEINVDILQHSRFTRLFNHVAECSDLLDLNALAGQLSRLRYDQPTAFEGLMEMELAKTGQKISVPRLIDLAASARADCCHVIPVSTDAELGRFYAENGFIYDFDELRDEIFENLNFEKLGREAREAEHGVFVRRNQEHMGGYVVRDGELQQAYAALTAPPKEPYGAVVMVMRFNGAELRLDLPGDTMQIDRSVKMLGAASLDDVELQCVDCRAPSLIDAVNEAGGLSETSRLATVLARLERDQMTKYKAVLEVTRCNNISDAVFLADCLEDFILSPDIVTPKDMALGELKTIVDDKSAAVLTKHLDLEGYGRELLSLYNSTITEYGMLGCKYCQTMESVLERHRQQRGGMTFEQSF